MIPEDAFALRFAAGFLHAYVTSHSRASSPRNCSCSVQPPTPYAT